MNIRICGGRLIDPANGTDEITDLYLSGGKVVSVGKMPDGWNGTDLDAEGMIVSPGFIDLHMHEDPLTRDGKIDLCIFDAMLKMGVTTAVGGNCGGCAAHPLRYLDTVDRYGCPVNVAMLAGHGWFRVNAGATDKYAPATKEQREKIASGIREAIDGGCAGVSFGVRYYPGADRDELYAAAGAAEGTGKLLAAHVRDDADAVFGAIKELTDMGRAYSLPVEVSHIGSMAGFGQMEKVLADLDDARNGGLDLAMDCYPYTAFSTGIGETTYDDGWLARYACDYGVLEYCEGPWKGQRATKETFDVMRREYPEALTVCYVMKKEDVSLALSHPFVSLASDGVLNGGSGHPRAAGTFPRFLRMSLDGNTVPLTEAIRKMTALPASRLGVSDRKGHLGVGADADVTVFDPMTVTDRAAFADPLLPPAGIRAVIVGGEIALSDGMILNRAAGKSVRV